MLNFFNRLDEIAQVNHENEIVKWMERLTFICLVVMFLAEPHSIAITQIFFLIGITIWIIRLFIKPRLRLVRTPLDLPLWLFFGWTFISAIFSYAPDISVAKMGGPLLFLFFYFVVNNVRTRQSGICLASALIFSCMFNVVGTPILLMLGRGVQISGVKAESPLKKTKSTGNFTLIQELIDGDTILRANQHKIYNPDQLIAAIESHEVTQLRVYRPDAYENLEIRRSDLLNGTNALEKLGIESWKTNHYWRSQWTFSHYVTFAEILQFIASLIFGLFISRISKHKFFAGEAEQINEFKSNRFPDMKITFVLTICLIGILITLLLTVTRASQIAFFISAIVIVLINGNRKLILVSAAVLLPMALAGALFLQQSRQVGLIDPADSSTQYRLMMYRDGFRLSTSEVRNFVLGVGVDSVKRFWPEWNLFDQGRQPVGHFHSTPIQLLVERGFPALLLWLWILWVYAGTLRKGLKSQSPNPESQVQNPKTQIEKGIILGSLGGLIGFFTSGLVHYNLGDSEVAMGFFMLMGLSVGLGIKNGLRNNSA